MNMNTLGSPVDVEFVGTTLHVISEAVACLQEAVSVYCWE